jgi:stage V sporulation protein SpoVS
LLLKKTIKEDLLKIPSFDNIGIDKEERHAPQNKLMNRFTAIYFNRSLNG